MRRYAIWMMTVGAAVAGLSCGGDTPTVTPTPAPPTSTTTLPSQPSPTPIPSPLPSSGPTTQTCGPNLAAGPMTRFAISPRQLRTGGPDVATMFVRARPNWDEAICLDKDKSHVILFNANQRNSEGRECCYEGVATWSWDDPRDMIVDQSSLHPENMIFRFNIEPEGQSSTIEIKAELMGLQSYPWQSGSGYRIEPLRIVTMSAADIARDCLCIYRGNGIYEGARCPK
jgi:hypothetical protein